MYLILIIVTLTTGEFDCYTEPQIKRNKLMLTHLNQISRCISGELSKQYCAGGLHWNRNKNICDWPASAQCKDLGKHPRPLLFVVNLT